MLFCGNKNATHKIQFYFFFAFAFVGALCSILRCLILTIKHHLKVTTHKFDIIIVVKRKKKEKIKVTFEANVDDSSVWNVYSLTLKWGNPMLSPKCLVQHEKFIDKLHSGGKKDKRNWRELNTNKTIFVCVCERVLDKTNLAIFFISRNNNSHICYMWMMNKSHVKQSMTTSGMRLTHKNEMLNEKRRPVVRWTKVVTHTLESRKNKNWYLTLNNCDTHKLLFIEWFCLLFVRATKKEERKKRWKKLKSIFIHSFIQHFLCIIVGIYCWERWVDLWIC